MQKAHRKRKVIVCGAGIGGLTVAHQLSKQGIDVVVYERNDAIGGLARSAYHTEGGHRYPVEYSWRVYGIGYTNLLRILAEIPLQKARTKSVIDHLYKARTYIFPRMERQELIFSPNEKQNRKNPQLPFLQDVKILEKVFFCVTMSKARMDSLDDLTWKKFCEDLSPKAQKYLVTMWGPVLGMDPSLMSFPVVARFVGLTLAKYSGLADAVYLMNQPTNDGWFDEWAAHLKRTGHVRIQTHVEIKDLLIKNDVIEGVVAFDHKTGTSFEDRADYVVCSMGVETIADIVKNNPKLKRDPSLTQTIRLAEIAYQVQLSVQVFLNEAIVYPTDMPPILYLPDSAWALIIEPQDLIWGQTYSTDPRVKCVLSVGICQTDAPGIVHQKPFTACNRQEIQDEVIAQMTASYAHSKIRTQDGSALSNSHVVLFYVWDSFTFDETKGRMTVWEPKFSNNAGALQHQPHVTTGIENLLFATAYIRTDQFIYSMESAAAAGVLAANEIFKRERISSRAHVFPFKRLILPLQPLVWLDAVLFRLHVPHVGHLFGSTILVVTLYALAIIAFVIRIMML